MKIRYLALPLILLFTGCAVYKQLTPLPPLSPAEQGFIELKKKDADFVLKRDKKYFIAFPAPAEDNFYLVLDIPGKDKLRTVFTPDLVKKKAYSSVIADETLEPATTSVYPVGTGVPEYFWIIDAVDADEANLSLKYRYVPQWRFKFENQHAAFKTVLEENKMDRDAYDNLGGSYRFPADFNYANGLAAVGRHQEALHRVNDELKAIESIFPAAIVNSQDPAYQNFLALRKALDDELQFLRNYAMVLSFFQGNAAAGADVSAFIGKLKEYHIFFRDGKEKLPARIMQETQRETKSRIDAVAPFINGRIANKADRTALDDATFFVNALPGLDSLCRGAGLALPADLANLTRYANDFNGAVAQLEAAEKTRDGVLDADRRMTAMPDDAFYGTQVKALKGAVESLPLPLGNAYGFYTNFKASKLLNSAIKNTGAELQKLLQEFRQASELVPRLNAYKAEKNYRAMIALLNRNRRLGFLYAKYAGLDVMSVDKQVADVQAALAARKWRTSEQLLTDLHNDATFMDMGAIQQKKRAAVLQAEDALYTAVDKLSREQILAFVDKSVTVLENIDSLYADSVFMPAYNVTFSSGSQRHLQQKKRELVDMLAKMKENEFPARAINLCYDQFMANPDEDGVLKARAVVTHGKHYLGSDKKLRIKIAECDPYSAKRVSKVKTYRRVFALPVTDNRAGGVNRYFCRFNLDVPSNAKFPVWDVTVKLPKTVAERAGSEKWYEKITLNKKLLKNEGRFTISAPDKDNGYECQITPVQTKKGRRNVLDIYFKHPSFKAHQVSVMVQKPIIKKN